MVPNQIKDQSDRDVAVIKGALPAGHEQFDYDGDPSLEALPDKQSRLSEAFQLSNICEMKRIRGEITVTECRRLQELAFAKV